jgi:hypothetical protein
MGGDKTMNTMKKMLVAVAMFIGLISVAEAGYYTTRSTAVCITTGTDIELLSVEWSSGSVIATDAYFILADVACWPYYGAGLTTPATTYGNGEGTVWADASQLIAPPVVLTSTVTAAGQTLPYWNKIDFTNGSGEGRVLERGLWFLQPGTHPGTVFTFSYRQRRNYGR